MFRQIEGKDFGQIISILKEIQENGDSYFFENMSEKELLDYWLKEGFAAFVYEEDAKILGSYILGPIAKGRFSHIANASYIVSSVARGGGIGTKLGLHSIDFAKKSGYNAIQFLQVVSTNTSAVELWHKIGFVTIGRVPAAFRHEKLGFVDSLIMYISLI